MTQHIGLLRGFLRRLAGWYGWRADAACLGLGAISAFALPPFFMLPALLITVPALLTVIGSAPRPVVAARRGWWFGFGLHLIGLYWVTEAILYEAARFWWLVPLAVPALAATLALFIGAAAWAAWFANPGWPRAFTLAGAWVLADIARQFVGTGFPWNPLGSVWEFPGTLGDIFVQAGALVSVHGMTLATLLLASVPLLGWRWRVAGAALFAAWAAYGVARLRAPEPPGTNLTVVLVQGNVAQGQKWDRALVTAIFRRYLALTESAMSVVPGPAVAVWPETAFPLLLDQDARARGIISEAAGGRPALIGSVRFADDGRPRNSLFALLAGGEIAGTYDKWHLVPFGEYQPDWFPFGIQVVPGGGFGRGPGARTLHVPGLPSAGPLICYEAIFPGQVVDPADRPEWLVNVTNDAWFGNSSGPRQHLAAARLRAVEQGLPLLRAANTGISAVFDSRGHELQRLGLGVAGTLTTPLPPARPAPLFARVGLLLPGSLACVCVVISLTAGRRAQKELKDGRSGRI